MTSTAAQRQAALRRATEAAQRRAAELLSRSVHVIAEAEATVARLREYMPESEQVTRLVAEIAGLRAAMESRAVIEQAKGIIIGAVGSDADRAFEMLARQSQHENRKLREVAEALVASKQRQKR